MFDGAIGALVDCPTRRQEDPVSEIASVATYADAETQVFIAANGAE
jgi:hypothetical protein